MTTVIEKALATAKTDPGIPERVSAEFERLTAMKQRLLPIEKDAFEAINEALREVELRQTQIELGNLPRLDPVVFSWTKRQKGWRRRLGLRVAINAPAFAYIPLNANRCRLHLASGGDGGWFEATMPSVILTQYQKVINALPPRRRRLKVSLTYKYAGAIPDHIKEVIQKERDSGFERFSEMGFVCEVDRWQVKSEQLPRPQLLDPILVGIKNNAVWVVATFDPTPVEEYVVSEFTK